MTFRSSHGINCTCGRCTIVVFILPGESVEYGNQNVRQNVAKCVPECVCTCRIHFSAQCWIQKNASLKVVHFYLRISQEFGFTRR